METKPYSIQSPEQIAKDYGGNKQKIAEAMQMGVVDPTAGTLAGMFIDRMRSAAQAEQVPQQTVAQQVFSPPAPPAPMGGPPPAPTGAPPAPPAGLGATPQATQMQIVPPMPEASEAEAPPMGMAEGGMVPPYAQGGGLTTLPLPDTMFDEPDNGGYADGGIVAFAGGGDTDPLNWMRSRVTSKYGEKRSYETHPGIDFGVGKDTPIGAPAPGTAKVGYDKANGNFVRIFHPDGTSSSYSHLSKATVKDGQEVGPADIIGLSGSTGRSTGPHLHFGARDADGNRMDPTSFFRSIAPQTASGKWNAGGKRGDNSDASSFDNKMPQLMDLAARYRDSFAKNATPENTRRDQLIKEIESGLSPEEEAKNRQQDKWGALAQLGFGIAGSKTPNFLQALGETASEVLPNIMKQRAADKTARRADVEALAALETKSNEEKQKIEALALEMAKAEAGLLSDERKMDLQYRIANMDDATKRMIAAASDAMAYRLENMRQIGETNRTGMTTAATVAAAQLRGANNGVIPGVTDTDGGQDQGTYLGAIGS